MVLRGRSQLVESFVWSVPLVRIDRLTALSLDSMDHGAWPFFVGGVICHVNSVFFVYRQKEEREKEEEKNEKEGEEREG